MKQFKYNVGDHVVIKESNIEWVSKFAGETGVILSRKDTASGHDYFVHPDRWGEEDDCDLGIYCKVKCLAKKTKKTEKTEKTPKYKVGDHVIIEESNIESSTRVYAGKSGTICKLASDPNYAYRYIVHPDDWTIEGGVYCKVKSLVPHTEKIVITNDGKTTTATLYDNDTKVKSASAKCSPDDKFDFAIGAAIAMDRLYPEKSEPKEEATPKYLDCKFVLTDLTGHMGMYFTEDKVYTMVGGRVENDCGTLWPYNPAISDVDDLRAYFDGTRKREPAVSGSTAKVIVLKEDC